MPYLVVIHCKDGTSSDTVLFPGTAPKLLDIVRVSVAGRTVPRKVLEIRHIKPEKLPAYDPVEAHEA